MPEVCLDLSRYEDWLFTGAPIWPLAVCFSASGPAAEGAMEREVDQRVCPFEVFYVGDVKRFDCVNHHTRRLHWSRVLHSSAGRMIEWHATGALCCCLFRILEGSMEQHLQDFRLPREGQRPSGFDHN